jgi:hypothetical protein
MSQLRAQCRSICTDNEIDNTLALVLRNRGNIGTIISPASSELELDDFQIEELKRKIGDQTTGDARGGMIGLSYPVKVDQTTQSPKDLQLNEVGSRPEASICAALGIHPMAVNLGEDTGKGGQYGAKYETVAGQTYDQAILPTLAAISEALTYQLLVDFPVSGTVKQVSRVWSLSRKWVTRSSTAGSDAKGYRVNFDYSDVRELGEAADAIHKRAGSDFQIYMTMTLDESREMMGMNPASDPEVGNKYLFQLVTPTLPGIVSTTPKGPEPKTPAEEEDDFPEEEDEEDGQDA